MPVSALRHHPRHSAKGRESVALKLPQGDGKGFTPLRRRGGNSQGAGVGGRGSLPFAFASTHGVHTTPTAGARVARGADGVSKPMIGRPMSAERAMRACRAMGEPALSADRG